MLREVSAGEVGDVSGAAMIGLADSGPRSLIHTAVDCPDFWQVVCHGLLHVMSHLM